MKLPSGTSVLIFDSTAQYYENGQLRSGRLASPARINNFLICDYISLREDGTLEKSVVKGNQKHGGFVFEGGEEVGFYDSGRVCYGTIVANTTVNGIPIKAGTIYLHTNGTLRTASLSSIYDGAGLFPPSTAKAAVLPAQNELPLKEGSWIDLSKTGHLFRGILACNQRVQGTDFPGETSLEFDDQGRLVEACSPSPIAIEGILFGAEGRQCRLRFHPSGKVATGVSGARQRYKNILIPENASVYFHPNGMIETISRFAAARINGVRFAHEVNFDSTGRLTRGTLAGAQTIRGIGFSECEVTFHPNGAPKTGLTRGIQTIQSVKIMANTPVTLHENGTLASAMLEGEQTIGGVACANSGDIPVHYKEGPPGTTRKGIDFFSNGKIRQGYLARDQRIDGIVCHGGTSRRLSRFGEASKVTFHENGRLASAYLACPQKIQGISLPGPEKEKIGLGKSYPIALYPNGKLETCVIGPQLSMYDVTYAAGSELGLFENKRVKFGTLAAGRTIGGIKLAGGTFVRFKESGELLYKTLPGPIRCGRITIPAQSMVFPDYSGNESQMVLARDATFAEGLVLKRGTQLRTSCSNGQTWLFLHAAQTIRNLPLPAGAEVALSRNAGILSLSFISPWRLAAFRYGPVTDAEFDEEGYIIKCTASEEVTIQDVTFPVGKEIWFFKDGTLIEWQLPENKRHKTLQVGKVKLLPEDVIVEKFPGGQIAEVDLAGNDYRHFNGLSYRHKIRFYPSGAVKELFLATSCRINNIPLVGQTFTEFHENGALKRGFPSDTVSIGDFRFSGDPWNARDSIGFYENGRIHFGILYQDLRISGKTYRRGGTLFLDLSGKITEYVPPPPPERVY